MANMPKPPLETYRPPTAIKLALLWATLVFLYIYNDYFSLYLPGTIADMMAGRMGPLGPASPQVLVGVSMMLAIPSLMIFLSVAMPALVSRWLNVLFGVAYTGIEVMTFVGSPPFYQIVVGFEIFATLSIIWFALKWPRAAS